MGLRWSAKDMKAILAATAAAVALMGVGAASTAQAQPPTRVFNGHQWCWYGNGWKGEGWYWCGNQWRRGYGWGGGRGWNGWVAPGVTIGIGPVGVRIGGAPRVWGGRHYCWYGNGWKGAGWYWCGYNGRRGYGWGGPRGWNHWDPDHDHD
jgi:hypothetical protein